MVEIEDEIEKSKIVIGNFNTHLSVIGRKSEQKKIRKDIDDLSNNQSDLRVYRSLHSTTAEYILFSRALGSFTKTDVLCCKTNTNKFQGIKITRP